MKEHAKLFEVRGQQVLAFLDHDEDHDNLLVMRLRLWNDQIDGPITFAATISSEASLSEATVSLWEKNTREGFANLDATKVDAAIEAARVWDLLSKLDLPAKLRLTEEE